MMLYRCKNNDEFEDALEDANPHLLCKKDSFRSFLHDKISFLHGKSGFASSSASSNLQEN